MRKILVEINEDSYQDFVGLISSIPKDKIRLWEEINYDDFFSEEDNEAYQKALRELKQGEAISLEDIKKEML